MSTGADKEAEIVNQDFGGRLDQNVRDRAQLEMATLFQRWLTLAYARGYADGRADQDVAAIRQEPL